MPSNTVQAGEIYQHYRNQKNYRIVCEAVLEASETPCVVYEALYSEAPHKFWVRPIEDFFATVELNGKTMKRFEKIQ